ncbi:MAG: HpcH/HpaI aldolase/citrate lyase family protein [Rhodobacter sp.]|nr:HpcH/HpaI aldolase/citrate lyase family protein [Rhodobacter sp.]
MAAPENRFKTRLRAGEMQIGLFLGTASPVVAEIAADAGFDWVLIDAEHGPNDIPRAQAQLIALQGRGAVSAVRVPAGEHWVLKQTLDIGAQTLLVPMVDTGAQAESIARATRYAPQGNRGLAAGMVRAARYGAEADYIATANDEICLMVQAESRAAVENIDAIAATDGVDCVFIGPSDLSADMGYPGDPGAPEVAEAIAHLIARTRAAGKAAGIFSADPAGVAGYRDAGVTVMAVGSDIGGLRSGLAGLLGRTRDALI